MQEERKQTIIGKRKKNDESAWVEDITSILLKRKNMMESALSDMNEAIEKAPKGYIRVAHKRNGYQYYLRNDPKDTNGIYLKQSEMNVARKIMQRDYYQRISKTIQSELKVIDEYINAVDPHSIENAYDDLPPGRQNLISPIIKPINQLLYEWESEKYEGKFFAPNSPEYYTQKDERVRSKSERSIANTLNHYGIPYHYEYPIIINGVTFHPDFYCLNLRTRKIFIWEHLGMMDDISYARENTEKIGLLESAGYMPGINLILTFETSKNPISDKLIRKQVETYLM